MAVIQQTSRFLNPKSGEILKVGSIHGLSGS
jgi:hypothetical protein